MNKPMNFRFQMIIATVACIVIWHSSATAQLRIATYNASLYGKKAGEIKARLADGEDQQASKIATVVQTVRPDILLVNELDYDKDAATAKLLANKFFNQPQGSLQPMGYDYVYSAPSNTGVDSGLDLNNNAQTGEPNDCWGYGVYPGQYSMAVFSRYPIDQKNIRTFQKFLWKDLPDARQPHDPESGKLYFSESTWQKLRLSSKNHIDVPIVVSKDLTIHVLASHPTPPVFDGREDRNGCRNHDEIRFWVDYLAGQSSKLVDDSGTAGGLAEKESFVIMGDLNSDPVDGDSLHQGINGLINHQRVHDPMPQSLGAAEDAKGKRAAERQKGNPALDTANFGGNLRVDYVLPSRSLQIKDAGVFWPTKKSEQRSTLSASDHRLVWIEVELP